jgi:phospholipid/cholesterol/gamma-HCH transport system ATP-binding protein
MVFQQAALFDSLTVEQNVGFLLYQYSKMPRSRIRELVEEKLDMVGLPGIGSLYPSELSGGMRNVSVLRVRLSPTQTIQKTDQQSYYTTSLQPDLTQLPLLL